MREQLNTVRRHNQCVSLTARRCSELITHNLMQDNNWCTSFIGFTVMCVSLGKCAPPPPPPNICIFRA